MLSTRIHDAFYLWLKSFVGMACFGLVHVCFEFYGLPSLLIGSFGASAVLLFASPHSPLAQARNVIGGHILSAFIGVSVALLLGEHLWLASALAVSMAIAAMSMTKTLHPPGGATALIAVIGGSLIHDLGYSYVLFPVAVGAVLLFFLARFINQCAPSESYPHTS